MSLWTAYCPLSPASPFAAPQPRLEFGIQVTGILEMAVGLNKGELSGPDTRLSQPCEQSPALPPASAQAVLQYPAKLDEAAILTPRTTRFVELSSEGAHTGSAIKFDSFIWADNWLALHQLLQEGARAKLIYLDPPYATGLGFASRDNEHAYSDALADASYIEFMRRRLILMRELLDEDGSIYVHIGHQMLGEMKLVLDEVFGAKNFLNLITRRKCSSKNFTRNQYANLHDYILFYSKSKNYIWNKPSKKPAPEWIAKEYPKVDERGQYKLVPVHAPGVRRGATGEDWRGMKPPSGKHWQYAPSKLDELDANGEIHWSKNGNPRRKVYLTDDKAVGYTDYWEEFRDAHHQAVLVTGYPTEKNFDMMKLIVEASSNPGDLVIDPFCGSGSTLHAASALGRRWIGIDQSFTAAKTVVKRLTSGRNPMGDYVSAPSAPQEELPLFDVLPTKREHTVSDITVYVDAATAAAAPGEIEEIRRLLTPDGVANQP